MKRLVLVRHAKSSWKDTSLSDFERPLNKRGKHDAPMMAKILHDNTISIELILTSPAKRAATTARFFLAEFGPQNVNIDFDDKIYEASTSDLIQIINNIDQNYKSAMLVGHNPGFTFLAEKLSGEYLGNIPTCGIAQIEFSVDEWKHISFNSGTLTHYDYPKKHY